MVEEIRTEMAQGTQSFKKKILYPLFPSSKNVKVLSVKWPEKIEGGG